MNQQGELVCQLTSLWRAYSRAQSAIVKNQLNWQFRDVCKQLQAQGIGFEQLDYDGTQKRFALPEHIPAQ